MEGGGWLSMPALVALTASARVGWYFALEVLAEKPVTPAWLAGVWPVTAGSLFFLCRQWPRRRVARQAPAEAEEPAC